MASSMQDRWLATIAPVAGHGSTATAIYEDLVARHGGPQRRYHTLDHVGAVLDLVDLLEASEAVEDPTAVRLAAWLHDVIYDPTRADNESRSAEHARRALSAAGVPERVVDETARLIELTAGHVVDAGDANAKVLVDADLGILGAPPRTYDRYAAQIRAEYAHVDDESYRVGRRRILEGFCDRSRIFLTDTARSRFEPQARVNLRREIDQLASG